ncbi:hypothetical protein [Allofournierella sp.]|uniref:aldose epimerase family protein n=1 Tax=Allofournierella sp. TaxID=1940256 RepID=UPI003AB6DB89
MKIGIENELFTARVDTLGAELCSLRRKADGAEFIWQGDPRYWSGHAPTLFPITGKLRDMRFDHGGKSYELPPHGFAKDREFREEERQAAGVSLVLQADEDTLRCYPFPFRLTCTFALTPRGLALTRRVENTGAGRMEFSMGEHLGLALAPLGRPLEECALVFPGPQTAWNWRLAQGLLDHKEPCLEGVAALPLSKELFRACGCLVLQGLNAPWAALRAAGAERGVRVSIGGFPTLVVWSPDNEGQFVCVEPWQGLPSRGDGGYELAARPCILHLEAGAAYEYTVTVEPE